MRILQHTIFHGVFRAPHFSGIPSMQDAEKEQRRSLEVHQEERGEEIEDILN